MSLLSFISNPSLLADLNLDWPLALLLLPLPWLVSYRKANLSTAQHAPKLPIYQLATTLHLTKDPEAVRPNKLKQVALILAWLSLVFACTRPSYVGEQIDIPLSGRDLMLAIDISPSMQELDLDLNGSQATRLEVVKSVVNDFVNQREGDRLGLILFGSTPYIQAPLSYDVVTINTLLQEAFLGMAGRSTAIGDAIALGVKRLRQRPEQSRVLILLSDGANTAGEIPPEKAAQLAAQENITIYTIGVGADEMIKRSFFGSRRVNPSSDLDETMLRQIASLTNGEYFRARNTQELEAIYAAINAMEPVERETRSYRPSKALYYYFLGFSLTVYLLMMFMSFISRREAV